MLLAAGGVDTGILEGVLEIAGGDFEARSDAEEETDAEGEKKGPAESGPVDAYGAEQWEGQRPLMGEVLENRIGEDEAEKSACAGEQERFSEELTDEAATAGTQGDAEGARPLRTFPSFFPQGALDRIYYRGRLRLHAARRCRFAMARVTSDHLPLIADFELS